MPRSRNARTEATMSAVRVARGFTGRDRVVMFEGCYHGHSDGMLAAGGSGMATLGLPASAGVPTSAVAETVVAVEFHHAAFDMKDWEEWLRAIFFAGERGVRRVWGPGRHLFGNNLFSYYKDPEGNTVEYTAEVEQLTDPDRQIRVQEPFPDLWVSTNRT